ncbi:MAG: hypothetical protein SGILL_001373 [Bacillariaceae sp.]
MSPLERSNSGTTNASSSSSSSDGNAIRQYDVLCGRGGLTNSHLGNKNFRAIVAEYQSEYLVAKKKDKKIIAQRIVDRIERNGGRFLKRSAASDVWSEVTSKKALEKTSQALREGLDVRHKTVRPEKLFHPRDSDEKNPRKRTRLVEGLVMASPQIMGMSGHDEKNGADEMPDLKDEMGGPGSPNSRFEPLFNFYPTAPDYPAHIGSDSFENVEEI